MTFRINKTLSFYNWWSILVIQTNEISTVVFGYGEIVHDLSSNQWNGLSLFVLPCEDRRYLHYKKKIRKSGFSDENYFWSVIRFKKNDLVTIFNTISDESCFVVFLVVLFVYPFTVYPFYNKLAFVYLFITIYNKLAFVLIFTVYPFIFSLRDFITQPARKF